MVIPVLQFVGIESFATLVEPDAYYVVTAEQPDNSMRLSLAYKNPACPRALPPCLTFEARTTTYSVIVMSDAAIRGNIWEQHVLAALRAMNVPLTAPDTPLAHRLFSPGAPNQYGLRDAQVRADKAFQPLRRALHNDRAKIHMLTQNATEQKLTDPAIATAVRNPKTQLHYRIFQHFILTTCPTCSASIGVSIQCTPVPRERRMQSTSPCSSRAAPAQLKPFATSTTCAQSAKQ
jgi:hypothetical protein